MRKRRSRSRVKVDAMKNEKENSIVIFKKPNESTTEPIYI